MRLNCGPCSCTIVQTSEIDTVENSRAVPPATSTPTFAAAACGDKDIAHGLTSEWVWTTPTNGFAIASSSRPVARRCIRLATRIGPLSAPRERHAGSLILASRERALSGADFMLEPPGPPENQPHGPRLRRAPGE